MGPQCDKSTKIFRGLIYSDLAEISWAALPCSTKKFCLVPSKLKKLPKLQFKQQLPNDLIFIECHGTQHPDRISIIKDTFRDEDETENDRNIEIPGPCRFGSLPWKHCRVN